MYKELKDRISDQLSALIEKAGKNAKKSFKYGTDFDLYRSEIHVIHIIGNHPGIHVMHIAELFGVTKGAISQVLKKLQSKGFITKEIDESNQTRILVYLTEKGRTAYETHIENHKKTDGELFEFFNNLDEEQLKLINKFLDLMDDMMNNHI